MYRRRVGLISGVWAFLFLVAVFSGMFNLLLASGSGTIYIRVDGSIDPPTAPIYTTDKITYTFTGNITDSIVVQRDNIVVDGAGYTVQGTGASDSKGISLSGRSNVTIKNTNVKYFYYGIWLDGSSNNSIAENNIANNGFADIFLSVSSNNSITANTISESPCFGIHLDYSWDNVIENNTIFNISYPGIDIQLSSNNIIRNNTIFDIKEGGIRLLPRSFNNIIEHNSIRRANYDGIELNYADNNILANNEMYDVGDGILMYGSSNNAIVNNNISAGDRGINLYISSENNTIRSNTISSSYRGICLHYSSDGNIITNNDIFSDDSSILLDNSSRNIVYHNNFVGKDKAYDNGNSQWDYNYWGDYTGLDTDGDGIGDEACYIYPNGMDNHPLMSPTAIELSQVPMLDPIAYKEILEESYRITGEQTIENETIKVSRGIDVVPGSTLTLRNVTLIIEKSGGWLRAGIFVSTGGSLSIYQTVIIGKGFTIVVRPNSTFVMRDSELHGCGVSLVESLKIMTDGAVVENNLITNSHEGVCIFSSPCRVVNNRILRTFRGISVEDSGNIIMNNTIIGCVTDGIFIYGAGAVNNTITNNFISEVWRNCIGGDDVAKKNVIMGNTLSNSPPDEFGPAKFTFSNLSINPTEIEAGNTVLVSVKVTNIGKQEGSYTIKLKIADEFVDDKTVTLEGGGSTTVSFTVIKEEAGSYDVDIEGRTGTLVVKAIITVLDATKPVANAGRDQTVNVGATVTFDASGSTDNVDIVSYEWDFGDGTTGTGITENHTYTSPGTYTVTLTVKDAAGNTATNSITITVLSAEGLSTWIIGVTVLAIAIATAVAATILWKRRRNLIIHPNPFCPLPDRFIQITDAYT